MKNVTKKLSVGLLGLVFLLTLVSVSPVEAKVPMRMNFSIGIIPPISWSGDIWTDDGSHGYMNLYLTDYTLLSNGQKGSVIWLIDWDDGSHLEGTLDMTFVYATHGSGMDGGEVVGNGIVTEASPEWSDWDGRNVHVMASVSPWPWIANGVFQMN